MTRVNSITGDQRLALEALLTQAREQRHRRLIWLTGNHQDCLKTAREITRFIVPGTVWISDLPPRGVTHLGAHKANELLGTEIPTLVFDAHQRFNPDALAAACGAIRAGGLALLLTPDALEWPAAPDLDKARIAVHPYGAEQIGNRFIRRLILQLGMDRQVIRWSCGGEWKFNAASTDRDQPSETAPTTLPLTGLTNDQQTAVDAITSVVIGHRRRPAVLIADRGRGKSAAMGIAAASLLAVRCDKILVTAPRKSACDSLFKHAEITLSEQASQATPGLAQLIYVAPDELIENPISCDLLLVDEAAGLPVHLLQQLLKHYSRIAFATTTHGYEGSGRGFLLRFTEHLDQTTPGWRRIDLQQPIRYAENDPLEQTLFQTLVLNANLDPRPCPVNLDEDAPTITRVNRDQLIHDETQLRAIYSLLVMAHYRTRPLDLRQLLDGPNVRIWTAVWRDQVIAAALVCREGDIEAALANKVFSGERRPRGHLIAQTLIGHLGIESAAAMEGERIMRIVVHPLWQNRGIGQTLVKHIRERAATEGLQWCGSSFGATEPLLRFWWRCGMLPFYIGSRREPSSGAHSVMVITSVDEVGVSLQAEALERFRTNLPHWLAEPLRGLETHLIGEIYRQLAAPDDPGHGESQPAAVPRPISHREWRAFATKQRSYEEALPVLVEQFLTVLSNGLASSQLEPTELQLLIMKLLQKRSWKSVTAQSQLTGRAEIIDAMRCACNKLSHR